MLIKREDCCLLVIDVQARLLPEMYDPARLVRGCRRLLENAAAYGIPMLVTEHYAKGIGHTADALADLVPASAIVEKIFFSCLAEAGVRQKVRALGRSTFVMAGIEAHVCLGQTALDLAAAGYRVVVSSDATASRTQLDHETALYRLERDGVDIMPTELILADWSTGAPEMAGGLRVGRTS